MQALLALLRSPRVIAPFFLLVTGGVIFSSIHSTPLFSTTDSFALFATEELTLEQEVQVSSGNLGSNNMLALDKNVIATSDLFGKTITLDKDTIINGNASYRKLKKHKDAQILGVETKNVELPIANFPEIPDFQIGTQDLVFQGTSTSNVLPAGNYRDITLEKNSRLTLTGGAYNLQKLELKDNTTLVFNASTTINIQFKLRGYNHVAILPGLSMKPDDLKINHVGIRPKTDNSGTEDPEGKQTFYGVSDDDREIEVSFDNDKERKDWKSGKAGRPILFGERSFLNFRLTAPKANVAIGKESTLRGQVLARKIKVKKSGVVSRKDDFTSEPDPTKVVTEGTTRFLSNEIVLQLATNGTLADATAVANSINGKISGIIPELNLYKIETRTSTFLELQILVQQILDSNNPLALGVTLNFLLEQQ
ncbi:MAG: hypothetical protein Q7S52_02325 [bacterium]|nr:hypothetical protein [bacterium]